MSISQKWFPHPITFNFFEVVLKKLIGSCCKTCWKLNISNKVSRQSITAGEIEDSTDLVLPYSSKDNVKHHGMEFVSLVSNPSVVYITKKESASAIPRKLIGTILNAWPVLIVALLLSVVSGVFLWFLVRIFLQIYPHLHLP